MSRSLLQAANDTQPLHQHHAQRPFHLNTAASVVIVFCGLGASISFMGAVALYFWCFKRPRELRSEGQQQGEYLGSNMSTRGDQPENRAAREMISKRIVEQLPVITSFGGHHEQSDLPPLSSALETELPKRRSAECCSVCLTEFVNQEQGRSHGEGESLEEGLKVRQLPECGHCFHTECIQLWLCSYLSCPLCRRNLGNLLSGEDLSTTRENSSVVVNQLQLHREHMSAVSATVAVQDHVTLEIDDPNPVGVEIGRNISVSRSGAPESEDASPETKST